MRKPLTFAVTIALLSAAAHAAAPVAPQHDSFTDHYPWLRDFLSLFAGLGIILFLVWLMRPSRVPEGFRIIADEQDIIFAGDFPAIQQQTVIDFLRNDCNIPGAYEVRGHWEERILIIVVRGDAARPLEQRIRNFLKITLKPPRAHSAP